MPESLGELALVLTKMAKEAGRDGIMFVGASEARAERLARILWAMAPAIRALPFPPWDCLPYDRVRPSGRTMGLRIAALSELADTPDRPWILLATPEALIQRLPPRELWAGTTLHLAVGCALKTDELRAELLRLGYWEDDRIDETGEFAIRGQVVDIFPAGYFLPVRLEHADGRVTAISSFDAASQRRTDGFERLDIRPVSEAVTDERDESSGPVEHRLPEIYPELETLLDYAPKARLIFEPRAQARLAAFREQIADGHETRTRLPAGGGRPLAPDRLFVPEDQLNDALDGREAMTFTPAEDLPSPIPRFTAGRRPAQALASFLKSQAEAGRRVILAGPAEPQLQSATRLIERAGKRPITRARSWEEAVATEPGHVSATLLDLDRSFVAETEKLAVVATSDLIGSGPSASSSARAGDAAPFGADEFHLGDAVIHLEHGVGLLDGIETLRTGEGPAADMIRLTYAGDTKLMVPVTDLDLMWRYGASAGIKLDRPDSDAWPKRRAKVEAEINRAADRLASLAKERDAIHKEPIAPPRPAFERFVARFPFTETPDQGAAVADILRDLGEGRPMDRLVCGDVGFGKTEVALRAAAAVALAGHQVAIVAPTTVLVRQHLQTFSRRFEEAGISVEHLSRLVKPADAKRVKAGLADGTVRVVVGTHALAAKDVSFADLALLVIDEEQRFGTAHKDRLRALGENVHVLTMTATPIPRTLQSALAGLQEVSVLATPPAERQPVRTFATSFDEVTVREALLRERRRGGQSFVVCPRIEDIEPVAARLTQLVPELTTLVAHGKLPADEIDRTMVGFADGEGDVLLATNIIESGLDVPRANTILIWRADLFGLSQLHQLRGRVGRGRARGFAYLLTDRNSEMTPEIRKRLGTLERLDRLGSGFAISAEDLDQRGAGDLLGDKQAGHVKLIGAGLYRRLLERAFLAASGRPVPEEWSPELNLDLPGHIPADYVPEAEVRINLYARIARLTDGAAEAGLLEEMEDRFGPVPDAVRGIVATGRLRRECRELGVARIDAGPQAIALTFKLGRQEDDDITALMSADKRLTWRGERLVAEIPTDSAEARLGAVEELLDRLPARPS